MDQSQLKIDWNSSKIDASFHKKLVTNGMFYFFDESEERKKNNTTAATFKIYSGNSTVSVQFDADKNQAVTKNCKTNYLVSEIVQTRPFEGSCMIGCSSYRALIENIIEANKRIHLLTLKDNGKNPEVINLYMKNCPFVLDSEKFNKKTGIEITNQSTRQLIGSIMTLNSVVFPGIDVDPVEISYIVNGI